MKYTFKSNALRTAAFAAALSMLALTACGNGNDNGENANDADTAQTTAAEIAADNAIKAVYG